MFPKNILQFLFVLLISIFICSPIGYLSVVYIEYQKIISIAVFVLLFLSFIGIVHFINYRKKIRVQYVIKPLNFYFLFFSILIIWILQIIVILPINFYFFPEQNLNIDLYWVVSYLILSPILEEIVFRNILLNSLLNSHGRNKAIVISSIFFGLAHGYFPQVIFATIAGLFLGLVYSKERNIAHTILLHFFGNLLFAVFQYYFVAFHNTSFYYIGIGLNIIVSFALLYYMYKKYGYSVLKLIKQT